MARDRDETETLQHTVSRPSRDSMLVETAFLVWNVVSPRTDVTLPVSRQAHISGIMGHGKMRMRRMALFVGSRLFIETL
jgi:hypothetical protein